MITCMEPIQYMTTSSWLLSPKVYNNRDKEFKMDSYINQMNSRINAAPYGSCFVVSDFTDIMDYETAKKNIARL